jgi:hypothetical protein
MKAMEKEYELVIDYCAFMVAIVLARHVVTVANIKVQWSAEQLALSLNKLDYSNTPNLRVHTLALKHGISLFKTLISKNDGYGNTVVPMNYKGRGPLEYFTLAASKRTFEVIFGSVSSPRAIESQESLMCRVLSIRDHLMSKSNYKPSPNYTTYHSASSVYAALYIPLILEMEKPVTVSTVNKTQLITRKSPSKLTKRAIKNSADEIIASTEMLYGRKNITFYLESALIQSKKRKINQNDNVLNNNNIINDSNNENNLMPPVGDFINDSSVLNALTGIPDDI